MVDKLIDVVAVGLWLYIVFSVIAFIGVAAFAIWFVPKFIRDWKEHDKRMKEMRKNPWRG